MWRVILLLLFIISTGSCRCQSDLTKPPESDKSGFISKEVRTTRWCRACALKSFLSCQRVTGIGSESEIRRKAELTACKDIGYSESECTQDKIRFVECGTE